MSGRWNGPVWGAAFVVALAVAYSCTPFGGNEPPAEREAGTRDAAVEVGPRDDAGLSIRDGSSDGSSATLQPTLCSGRLLLADAFDRPAAASEGWSVVAGDVLMDTAVGSPPPALFASTPELENGAKSSNSMKRTFQLDGATAICVELDLLVDASRDTDGDSAFTEIVTLLLDKKLYVEMQRDGLSLTSGSGGDALGGFALGTWQHLALRVPLGGSPTLSTPGGATATLDQAFSPNGDTFGLETGANSDADSTRAGACRVHLDNLVVTATP